MSLTIPEGLSGDMSSFMGAGLKNALHLWERTWRLIPWKSGTKPTAEISSAYVGHEGRSPTSTPVDRSGCTGCLSPIPNYRKASRNLLDVNYGCIESHPSK